MAVTGLLGLSALLAGVVLASFLFHAIMIKLLNEVDAQ